MWVATHPSREWNSVSIEIMTDDEARAILQSDDCSAWIRWDDKSNQPQWYGDSVYVDGSLTEDQMMALSHFKPK